MKKTLSLLLVLAMVLSSFGFAFAAEEEATPAEILNDLGVLKGNASGDLMLENNLKRQDMVVMLSRLLGVEEEAKAFEGETTFEDVVDPFYVPYIAWAEAKELTNGKAEGKFGFDEFVTEQQVLQFMLRALGYDEVEWDEVPAKAVELGLVEKDADLTVDATRERLAALTLTALKTNVKDSEKTLAETLELELPEPEVLEVEEVVADNLKEIKVVFNKAVNENVAENIDLYTTNASAIEDARIVDDNIVVLSLTSKMTNKREYKLTIRGFEDVDSKVNGEFKFKAYDNTVPEVEEIAGLGTKAIKVVMSEPIKGAKSSNFVIDGKSYYGSVKTAGRDIILKPYGSDFAVGDHKMVVKSLEDYNKFKSVERELEFTIAEDKDAPMVEEVKGTLERIVVTFDEDVDEATVSRDSLYWGGVKSNKAEKVTRLSGNRYAFEFSGSKALPTYETTLTVKDIKDYSGNAMKAQDIAFKAELDETRPEVLDTDVSSKEIEIKFNKRLNEKDAEDKSNYSILDENDKKVSFKTPELSEDGRTVTINLYSKLKSNKDYTLKITSIRDNTKLANTMLPYEETISAGNYNRPEVTAVTANAAKETIHILFNKKMDVETIADPANYMLQHKDKTIYALDDIGGDVNVIQNGRAVILDLEGCKINGDKVKDLEFGSEKDKDEKYLEKLDIVGVILSGSIQDTAENRVQKYGRVIEFDKDAVTATAEAVDKRTIELTFTHPVTAARKGDFKATNFTIDSVEVDGTKVVVIKTVSNLTAGIKDEKLAINDENDIETVLDIEVKEDKDIKIVDAINPTLKDATGVVYVNDKDEATKLVLKLKFDEKLSTDYEELAKRDLVVKRADGKTIETNKDDVKTYVDKESADILVFETTQYVAKDTAYEIEIDKQGAIRDMATNVANKTDGAVVAEDLTVEEVEELTDDEKAADAVVEKINALPEEITLEEKEVVEAARAAYDGLTEDQKALVEEDVLKKLETAEAKIKDLTPTEPTADEKAVKEVADKINALPELDKLTLENKVAVEEARTAYKGLTEAQQKLVEADVLKKLTDAEAKIAELEKPVGPVGTYTVTPGGTANDENLTIKIEGLENANFIQLFYDDVNIIQNKVANNTEFAVPSLYTADILNIEVRIYSAEVDVVDAYIATGVFNEDGTITITVK